MSNKGSKAKSVGSSSSAKVTTNCSLASVKRKLIRAQKKRTDDRVYALQLQCEQASAAIEKKGWRRCSPLPECEETASATEAVNAAYGRKGRGVIDRFVFHEEDYKRTLPTKAFKKGATAQIPGEHILVGPASGLPHPSPDPRHYPPRSRTSRVVFEKATWSGVSVDNGVLEWSRVSDTGHKEWLAATEVVEGEWSITRSKSTKL